MAEHVTPSMAPTRTCPPDFSSWGGPAGRKVVVRCIADCVAHENEIREELVIYNNANMLQRLLRDAPLALQA